MKAKYILGDYVLISDGRTDLYIASAQDARLYRKDPFQGKQRILIQDGEVHYAYSNTENDVEIYSSNKSAISASIQCAKRHTSKKIIIEDSQRTFYKVRPVFKVFVNEQDIFTRDHQPFVAKSDIKEVSDIFIPNYKGTYAKQFNRLQGTQETLTNLLQCTIC